MDKNNEKLVENYLVREVSKEVRKEIVNIIIKFACAIGLTYLAVKYGIIQTVTAPLDNVTIIFSGFCVIYFWFSIMQVAFQSCRLIITGLITGMIACVVILWLGIGLFPEEVQGYVFVTEMTVAVLYDIVRLVKRVSALANRAL